MAVLELARQHRSRQQRLAASAVATGRSAWRLLDQHAIDATLSRFLARLVPMVARLQETAAQAGAAYVDRALAALDVRAEPVGGVQPARFSGVASDGRPLASLLSVPAGTVKRLSAQGMSVTKAMAAGRDQLDRILATQVADAGRVATGVGVAARPRVGYVRMVVPPSCARCVILAGRYYRWNAGFQRHPLCDCVHIPASEAVAGDLTTDPRAYFDSLSQDEQNRIFTAAGARAIRDGADIGQVVNARRGMYSAGGRALTRSGIVRGAARGRPVRLMPEQIYRVARSRDEAVALLRDHGYIS